MFRLKYLPHKKDDEQIVFFLRRHWFIIIKIIFVYGILALIPALFYWVLVNGAEIWLNNELAKTFLVLLGFTYYLFWWLLLYHAWLDYYLDIWIVTSHRVINIEQKGLFNRFIAEHKLFRIQDVVSKQQGMLPTLLNYGEVHIQTAGSEKTVVFEQVSRPHYVAQETIKLVEWRKQIVAKTMEKMEKLDEMEGIE